MNVKGKGLLHWCQPLKSEEPLLWGPFNNMFEFKGLATVDSNEWIKGVKWCSEENSLTATWKDTHTLTHIYTQSAHSVLYSVCLKDREREKAQERERQRQTTETLETAYKDHLYWLLIPSHLILLSFTSHFASSTTHYILNYVLVGQCYKMAFGHVYRDLCACFRKCIQGQRLQRQLLSVYYRTSSGSSLPKDFWTLIKVERNAVECNELCLTFTGTWLGESASLLWGRLTSLMGLEVSMEVAVSSCHRPTHKADKG